MSHRHERTTPRMSPRARRGFSLIELAAVGTALTLLAGMMAPALSSARSKSRSAVCLDRLAAIAATGRIYAAGDQQGFVIPIHPQQFQQSPGAPTFIGAYEWGGKSGIGTPGWTDGPAEGVYAWISSKYGTRAGFGPPTRPMNQLLYPQGFHDARFPEYDRFGAETDTKFDLPAYRCPSDTGPPGGAHCPDWVANPRRSSYDHFGNSYAANLFMTGYPGDRMWSNSPYLRPLSRLPNPARTIGYEENIGRWAWASRREIDDCTWIGAGVDPGPSRQLAGWHGKPWTYNRSFVDAHAETQTIYIEDTEDTDGYANHYYNEIVFEESGEQEQYRCIIVRGDGWQKDTMPAPRIPTDIFHGGDGRPSYEDCVQTTARSTADAPTTTASGRQVQR